MKDRHDPTLNMYLSLLPFMVGICLLGMLIGDEPCREKPKAPPPAVTPEKPLPKPTPRVRQRIRPERVA